VGLGVGPAVCLAVGVGVKVAGEWAWGDWRMVGCYGLGYG
jgi:hypothetical protein